MRAVEILLMTLGGVWQGIRQDFNLFEIALIIVGVWAWKRGRLPAFPNVRTPARPWLAALLIAGGAVALRLALVPLLPVPVPIVTDEFSHLLLADTLLHGRAANPTHQFWQHFESLHIIQQPHYVSNYFPGHAAVLAAARALFGHPWAGVLAECGIFLAVLYWSLRGWMPPRWALFGTLLAALRFAIGSYWINAYHGGFLAATGGALVFGSFARLVGRTPWSAAGLSLRRTTPSRPTRASAADQGVCPTNILQGVSLGAGLAILALTRPFEGMLYSLPMLAFLAWQNRRSAASLAKIGIPAILLSGAAVATLAIYNQHTTGNALVTPYAVSQATYGWPVALAWAKPKPIEHRHVEMARYYQFELTEHERVDGPVNFIEYLTFRIQEYWRFFLGPVLSIPLIMLPRVWHRRRLLFLALAGGIAAILLEGGDVPHYLAPATAVIIAILIECCRHLSAARIPVVPYLPATMILILTLRIAAQNLGLPYTQKLNYQSWCCRVEGNLNKPRIAAALGPGKHLVFVKPKTDEYNLFQWIYNDADIDASQIVWARDLGPERNAQLAAYFKDRDVWIVDPNISPAGYQKY